MSDYLLSIMVYGRGDDPTHRSHWAFALHRPGKQLCTLLHVNLIDPTGLIYQYEERSGQPLESRSAEGFFLISNVKADKYRQVVRIISAEPAPRNGKDRCQDWVLDCVIALETEELVPDGTAELIESLIGKNVTAVTARLGGRWQGIMPKTQIDKQMERIRE